MSKKRNVILNKLIEKEYTQIKKKWIKKVEEETTGKHNEVNINESLSDKISIDNEKRLLFLEGLTSEVLKKLINIEYMLIENKEQEENKNSDNVEKIKHFIRKENKKDE